MYLCMISYLVHDDVPQNANDFHLINQNRYLLNKYQWICFCIHIRFQPQTKRQIFNSYITNGSINILINHAFYFFIYFTHSHFECNQMYQLMGYLYEYAICIIINMLMWVIYNNYDNNAQNILLQIHFCLIVLPTHCKCILNIHQWCSFYVH